MLPSIDSVAADVDYFDALGNRVDSCCCCHHVNVLYDHHDLGSFGAAKKHSIDGRFACRDHFGQDVDCRVWKSWAGQEDSWILDAFGNAELKARMLKGTFVDVAVSRHKEFAESYSEAGATHCPAGST